MLAHLLLAAKAGVAAQCCATTRRQKAMSTDVYERISSQITNELEKDVSHAAA
jgi:hypothetical protein